MAGPRVPGKSTVFCGNQHTCFIMFPGFWRLVLIDHDPQPTTTISLGFCLFRQAVLVPSMEYIFTGHERLICLSEVDERVETRVTTELSETRDVSFGHVLKNGHWPIVAWEKFNALFLCVLWKDWIYTLRIMQDGVILLMEEILQQLGYIKPCN